MRKKPLNFGQTWIPEIQAGVEQSNGDRPAGMPALEVIKCETAKFGLPDSDAEAIYDAWLMTGFKTSRGIKIKDWRAAVRTWYRNGWFPSLRKAVKTFGSSSGREHDSSWKPPSKETVLAWARTKKSINLSNVLKGFKTLNGRGWNWYGKITTDQQWQDLFETQNFLD
jgi:hypothetical protein